MQQDRGPRHHLIAALLVLAACGGAEPTAMVEPPLPEVTPPVPPAPDTAGSGAVRSALFIDPANLPSYATGLPATYGPAVLQREDRAILNPITDAGATLGRVLFFERKLSRNENSSCAHCHQQALAFGDTLRFSLGFDGGATSVHSMRLSNARFNENGQHFWDRRAPTLEAQVVQPIQNAVEMGFDDAHGGLAAAVARVRAAPYYARLFKLAFGDTVVSEDRIQRALAQYVRSIVSVQSRWDVAMAQTPQPPGPPGQPPPPPLTLVGFTDQENLGMQLFLQPAGNGGVGCAGCHRPPTFSIDGASLSNGLDEGETRIFRSPSLKTVGMGNRYMHDGRFATLEEVVAFYSDSVRAGPALDNRLRTPGGAPRRLNLGAVQKAALVAFLRTLVDSSAVRDPRFSDPFRR